MVTDEPARTPFALDGRPPEPRRTGPSTGAEVVFHVLGAAILVVAVAVAGACWVLISWGASVCQADPTDPQFVAPLRRDLALVGLALPAVPAGWALLGKLSRMAWIPWALVSAAILALGLVLVLSTNEVSTWCF